MPGWGEWCCLWFNKLCNCCGCCGRVDSTVSLPEGQGTVVDRGLSLSPIFFNPQDPGLQQPMLQEQVEAGEPRSPVIERVEGYPTPQQLANPQGGFVPIGAQTHPTGQTFGRSPSPFSEVSSVEYQEAKKEPDQEEIRKACYRTTTLGLSVATNPGINKLLAQTISCWFNASSDLLKQNAKGLKANFINDFITRPGLRIIREDGTEWSLYTEDVSEFSRNERYLYVESFLGCKIAGNIGWGLLALLQQHPLGHDGFKQFNVDPIFNASPKPIFHYLFALITANRQEMKVGDLGAGRGNRQIVVDFSKANNHRSFVTLSTSYQVTLMLDFGAQSSGYKQEAVEMDSCVSGVFEAMVKLRYNEQRLVAVRVPYVRFQRDKLPPIV